MNNDNRPQFEPLWTTAEVAALFRVDTTTVTGWAKDGKLDSIRAVPGANYRFRAADVRALLNGQPS